MKSILGNKVTVGPFKIPLKDENGEIIMKQGKPVNKVTTDKKGMAEALNKTYTAVFTNDDLLSQFLISGQQINEKTH